MVERLQVTVVPCSANHHHICTSQRLAVHSQPSAEVLECRVVERLQVPSTPFVAQSNPWPQIPGACLCVLHEEALGARVPERLQVKLPFTTQQHHCASALKAPLDRHH